jgi:DNA topoisomerase-3
MPRTVCKREITREEFLVYLSTGKTELLDSFTSRFGRPFSARLVLKESGRHGFEFPPRKREGARGASQEAAADAKPTRRKATKRKPTSKKGPAKKKARQTASARKTTRKKAPARSTTRKKSSP